MYDEDEGFPCDNNCEECDYVNECRLLEAKAEEQERENDEERGDCESGCSESGV